MSLPRPQPSCLWISLTPEHGGMGQLSSSAQPNAHSRVQGAGPRYWIARGPDDKGSSVQRSSETGRREGHGRYQLQSLCPSPYVFTLPLSSTPTFKALCLDFERLPLSAHFESSAVAGRRAEWGIEERSKIASGSEKEVSRYQNRIEAGKGQEQRQESASGAKVLLISMGKSGRWSHYLPFTNMEGKTSFTRKGSNCNSHFS